jgi:predicted 2-oxoglutarate/Fe(II)-dependent dioxygenase YbiX
MTYNREDGGGKIARQRTNSEALIAFEQQDLVLMALRRRIATVAGLAIERMEPPTVLHYAPGQEFRPHYDFFDPAVPAYAVNVAERGQRLATVLVYLNDDFEGGETHFVKADLRFKGKKGDAILFRNVTEQGDPDFSTLHAGLPTTRGEKWLFSQWLRG